jgi:DNA-binding transcriptional ArsR family regulator
MDAALRALANGTRRRILALVWRDELTASEIAAKFAVSRPAISQHLGVLRASALVIVRRSGTRRLYRADRKEIAQLRALLGTFWDHRLEQLRTAAERAARRKEAHGRSARNHRT